MSIKPVLERLNSPEIDAKTRDQFMNQMGFAGPETLLVGLRKSIRFDQKEEERLDGKAIWVSAEPGGTATAGRSRQRPVPATGLLPAFIPSLATLYLGKDDGWPYKIVLVGKAPILQDTRRIGPDGQLIGSKLDREDRPQRDHAHLLGREAQRQYAPKNSPSRRPPTPTWTTTPR